MTLKAVPMTTGSIYVLCTLLRKLHHSRGLSQLISMACNSTCAQALQTKKTKSELED